MTATTGSLGAFVFQGSNLIFPDNIDISAAINPLSRDLVFDAFGGSGLTNPRNYYEIKTVDGTATVTGLMLEMGDLPPGWRSLSIRQVLAEAIHGLVTGDSAGGLLFRSYHLMQWRRDSAYCGSCGSLNSDSSEGTARNCPVCGRVEFPRISPAVIVLITNDKDEALLAHNANFNNGVYSLIAGFVEAGENLETTIKREVKEEVNIEVDRIRYAASQPWPFPNSLMLGFTAHYTGGELKPDGTEIIDAQWFSKESIPTLPGHGSVARYIINRWLKGET
ncbi:NAD(+) diphosphatase [Treponema primitia]|nr:NAD(+) diphosphatase [Treponema primitia]